MARTKERPANGRIRTREVADVIVDTLSRGPKSSKEVHERVRSKLGVSALYSARKMLGSKLRTGIREEDGVYWKLVR